MLLLAVVVYGEKAAGREYLLRRITHLSLYTFALLALAAKMARSDEGISERNRNVLSCLVEEAREVRSRSQGLADSRGDAPQRPVRKYSGKQMKGSVSERHIYWKSGSTEKL